MTDSQLNEVVHVCSDALEEAGLEMSAFDRCQLNDHLSEYIQNRGEEITED